jgi:sensor histidine kinase YesM
VLSRQKRQADLRQRQILLEREMLATRLAMLQAQIEPHFLYNTLANVQALARTDVRSSDTMLGHLIDYLRSAMPAMRAGTSTLGREFDLARAYLAIMRFRMGERLQFSVHAPAELVGHEFPPTLVGTLVENAVKHGLERSAAGGRIDVAASVDGSAVPPRLVVEVTDTGLGFSASSGSGVGLANARERLSLLYGADADLELMPNPSALTGISARVRIPLKRDQIRRSDADRLAA